MEKAGSFASQPSLYPPMLDGQWGVKLKTESIDEAHI